MGEIRIKGQGGRTAQARLAADAQLVGELLESEADLSSMTEELIQSQDQLLAVYGLAQLARRRVGVAETVAALAEAAARLLEVEGTAVMMAFEGRNPLAAQQPSGCQDEAWLVSLLPILSFQRQTVLWQGPGQSEQLPAGMRSLLMLPIDIGDQTQGGLVFWSEHGERFSSPEIKLARAIAEHAGAQIENAMLHQDRIAQVRLETEMALARRVQMNLLPKAPPALPGLGLFASTRPASHVGGDYFDFIAGPGGSTTILVGDVSGKGLSAALVMAMTRTILRSVVAHARRTSDLASSPGPAALLSLVNDEMYDDLTELSMFATVFAIQHHPDSRRLVYANAGHSPVIYKPAGGPAGLLEADSPPVGVLRTIECEDRILELGPGDILVAATDGFNEARDCDDRLFGIERLIAYVEANAHLPAVSLGQTLFAAVEAHCDGAMQEDDQTLVIAKGVPA